MRHKLTTKKTFNGVLNFENIQGDDDKRARSSDALHYPSRTLSSVKKYVKNGVTSNVYLNENKERLRFIIYYGTGSSLNETWFNLYGPKGRTWTVISSKDRPF